MKIENVLMVFGKASTLAENTTFSGYTISRWKLKGEVPKPCIKQVKAALRAHKRRLDKAYNEVMK